VSVPALPTAAAILDALGYPSARTSASRPDGEPAEITEQISALHRNNAAQWDREDDASRGHDDDAVVAAAKRDIDRLNRARHGFIEAIDRAILVVVAPHEGAPLVTETPGMAIDRLSVLVIRLAATEARAASGTAGARLFADRLPQLRSQLHTLEEAIATLLTELENGTRRFLAYESLKLYGPEDSERVG
jgi:hypothetical protein